MTTLETMEIMKIISKSYPNGNKIEDEETVKVWAAMFAEDDANIVKMAVIKHIATSKWTPSIAEIRDIMTEIKRPDIIPPDKAWEIVNKWLIATGEFGDDNPYSDFPVIIAEAVESAGGKRKLWALRRQQYGYSPKAGLDRLTFMRLYEPKYQRERQNATLPQQIHRGIEQIQTQIENSEYIKYERTKIAVEKEIEERKRMFYSDVEHLLTDYNSVESLTLQAGV
ncbi:hypothetical protein AGMMS49975_21190 [Clostridia bacterium]|nr:hypothetical protein AGMMS49975_21190 [Clostridia bacterium]